MIQSLELNPFKSTTQQWHHTDLSIVSYGITRRVCWSERLLVCPSSEIENVPIQSFQSNKIKQAIVFFYSLQREQTILRWSTKTNRITDLKHFPFIIANGALFWVVTSFLQSFNKNVLSTLPTKHQRHNL